MARFGAGLLGHVSAGNGLDRVLAAVARIASWSELRPGSFSPVPAAALPAPATGVWPEDVCREFLISRGIPVVPGTAEPTAEDAAAAVERAWASSVTGVK